MKCFPKDVYKLDSMPQEILSIALLLCAGCSAMRKDELTFDFFFVRIKHCQ